MAVDRTCVGCAGEYGVAFDALDLTVAFDADDCIGVYDARALPSLWGGGGAYCRLCASRSRRFARSCSSSTQSVTAAGLFGADFATLGPFASCVCAGSESYPAHE